MADTGFDNRPSAGGGVDFRLNLESDQKHSPAITAGIFSVIENIAGELAQHEKSRGIDPNVLSETVALNFTTGHVPVEDDEQEGVKRSTWIDAFIEEMGPKLDDPQISPDERTRLIEESETYKNFKDSWELLRRAES